MEEITRHFEKSGSANKLFKSLKSCKTIDDLQKNVSELNDPMFIEVLDKLHVELINSVQLQFEKNKQLQHTKPNLSRRIKSDGVLIGVQPHRIPKDHSIWRSISHLMGNGRLAWEGLYLLACHRLIKDFHKISDNIEQQKLIKYLTKLKDDKKHLKLLTKLLCFVLERDIFIYNVSERQTKMRRYLCNNDNGRLPIYIVFKNGRVTPLETEDCIMSFQSESVSAMRPLLSIPSNEHVLHPSQDKKIDDLVALLEDTTPEGKQLAKSSFSNNTFLDGERMRLVRWQAQVEPGAKKHTGLNNKLAQKTSFFDTLQCSGNISPLIESVIITLTGTSKYSKILLALYYQHQQIFENIKVTPSLKDLRFAYEITDISRICLLLYRRICVFSIIPEGIRCDHYTPPFVTFSNTLNIMYHFGKFFALRETKNPVWNKNNCIVYPITVEYNVGQHDKFREKISHVPSALNQNGFPPPNLVMYSYIPTSSHTSLIRNFPDEDLAKTILTKMAHGLIIGGTEDKINHLRECFVNEETIDWNNMLMHCRTLPMIIWREQSQCVPDQLGNNLLNRHGHHEHLVSEFAGRDNCSLFKAVSIAMFGSTQYHIVIRLLCVYALTLEHYMFDNVSTILRLSTPNALFNENLLSILEFESNLDLQSIVLGCYLISLLFRREIRFIRELQFGPDFQLNITKLGMAANNIEINGLPIYLLFNTNNVSLLLKRLNFKDFEEVNNQMIGYLEFDSILPARPEESNVKVIDSNKLLEFANASLKNGNIPQFLTHSSFGRLTTFPLSIAFSQQYLNTTYIETRTLVRISNGIVMLVSTEMDPMDILCPMDLDQTMKDATFGSYRGFEVANKLDFMINEERLADFSSRPLSANTIYAFATQGIQRDLDFLDTFHTLSDEITEEISNTYYVGVTGSIIPLQYNRLLTNVFITNYGTNSICWIIVCPLNAMILSKLLKKLTHNTENVSDCQLAYEKKAFITLNALRRNGIPFHFREHNPGETIVLRAGSYFEGICTGITVFRYKLAILEDYPLIKDSWELIPNCQCHIGERALFIETVNKSTKLFPTEQVEPTCCKLYTEMPENKPHNIKKSDGAATKAKYIHTFSGPPRTPTSILPPPVIDLDEPAGPSNQHPKSRLKQVQTYDSTTNNVKPRSPVNRLYPNLALVETENGESNVSTNVSKSSSVNKALEDGKSAEGSKQTECGESMVEEQDDENDDYDDTGDYGNEDDNDGDDDDEDDNDGDAQGIRHNFDKNASTVGEFHHWLNLLTHEEARNLLAVQRNEEFKDTWIQRQKWHDKKTSKRFRRGCKKGETVSQKYERLFNDIVETTARNERLIGEIPNTKTDEFVKIMKEIWLQHQNKRKSKKKIQKSNIRTRSMAPLVDPTIQVQNENSPIHTNQTNLEAILPIVNVSPPAMILPDGISPQQTQSQRISSNSSSRRPSISSSTASTVVPDDNQHIIADEEPGPSRRITRNSQLPNPKPNHKRMATRSMTRAESVPEEPSGTNQRKNRRINKNDQQVDSVDEEEDEEIKRRKSKYFPIGRIPIDDDTRPRADNKRVYTRVIPGTSGTYQGFGYTINRNKRWVCHGPCCKGKTSFARGDAFRQHVKSKTNNWPCDKCDQAFAREDVLRRHTREQHGSDSEGTIFTCDKCDKTFQSDRNLMRHKRYACKKKNESDTENSTFDEEGTESE